jgi:acyl-coenzyme A synthetase/AMP-(fatty) acid ligase
MNLNHLSEYKGEAIVDKNGSYSFNELLSQIEKYSKNLISNSNINKRVVVIDSDYSFYSISLLFALLDQNCIVVPIVKTTDVEFNSKIAASEANVIIHINDDHNLEYKILNKTTIIHEDFLNILNKNRSGIVLFSSGTTGDPKVMVHDYNNFAERFLPPRNQKTLRFMLFLMFDHIGGLNTLFNCINNGSPIIIPENRNPSDILNIIETKKVQILPTSPTFLNLMLQVEGFEDRDLSSLKLITYGTEKMPKILLEKLNILLPNVKYLQTFGTSETGILKTQSKSSNSLYFKIIDDTAEYKIENNQLLIKSKTAVAGYKDEKSNKFTEDGWFITGDLIELDEDGYMRIIGRINDVINVGGLKVLPSEVEEVINSIDGVIDSTVFARDNAITGQVVCAKIVVNRGADISELKKLIRYTCGLKLDKYKNPVKLILTDTIEYTSRFKKDNNDRKH